MESKVITVWGSNGSGKTVTSVKIAAVLAHRKILLSSAAIPIPLLCPY